MSRLSRFAPLTGVIFAVLGFAGFAISKANSLSSTASGARVIAFYRAHHAGQTASDILLTVGFAMFLLFAGSVRARLRQGDDREALGAVALVAAGVVAAGALAFFSVDFALASGSGQLAPDAAQALNLLAFRMVLPACAGMLVFGVAAGLAVIRSAIVPRWLGVIAVVIGLVGVSPLLTVALMALYVWTLVVAVILVVRAGALSDSRAPALESQVA
jgi:hypothetical protein